MNPLESRLASLRRALRLVVLIQGLSWLAGILVAAAALACLLDWLIPLASPVRAFLLCGTLTAVGLLAYGKLWRPLTARADDLSLALRIEARYPALNDSLASTIQFLQESPDSPRGDSAALRREAVRRTLAQARKCDFTRTVDTRGLRSAGLALELAFALAVPLLIPEPSFALTALARFLDPFGKHDWTRLELHARSVVAEGQPYEIQATLRGVVPSEATVIFWFRDRAPYPEVCTIAEAAAPNSGRFQTRLDQVPGDFLFQVRANDAVSEWREVKVLPPPHLVAGSLQLRLRYPEYTRFLPVDLAPGRLDAEAVEGTLVSLRAEIDRPVTRAWIESHWESHAATAAAGFLGQQPTVRSPAQAAALAAVGQAVWGKVPASVGDDGRTVTATFRPWGGGRFEVRFEDDLGLANSSPFYLTLLTDPAPTVNLMSPSAQLDRQAYQDDEHRVLTVDALPDARLTLGALAEDQRDSLRYGVRSIHVEYRYQDDERPGRLTLYNGEGSQTAQLQHLALATGPVPWTESLAGVRPQQVRIEEAQNLSLTDLVHLGPARRKPQRGDVLQLQVCSDDFDDVTVDKQPGRSRELLRVRVVGPEEFEAGLDRAQTKLMQDLQVLREQQRLAGQQTARAEQRLTPRPEEIAQQLAQAILGPLERLALVERRLAQRTEDTVQGMRELLQAEQDQQRIREQLGEKGQARSDNLANDLERLLESLRENHLQKSGTYDRLENLATELERRRLSGQMQQIESSLNSARKQRESGGSPSPAAGKRDPLREARQEQQKAARAFEDLLWLLEPGAHLREAKNEARALLEEQRLLGKEVEQLKGKEDFTGKTPEALTPDQRRELEQAATAQRRLEERVQRWLDKLGRSSKENASKDPETARALQEAREMARKADLAGQMKEARDLIQQNQLSKASDKQSQDIEPRLDALTRMLEQRREAELDRLAKKLAELDAKLQKLAREQDELRKKAREAAKIADPARREEELKRLARQQEQLQKKQEEIQEQLQQLSRKRNERAGRAVGQAGAAMTEAVGRLKHGEEPAEEQQEALDRLQEARRALLTQRAEAEEELAREQLEKYADQIKRLRERQEGHVAEGARIQREVEQRKEWSRGLLSSLSDLAQNQRDLGQETLHLIDAKLSTARVVARALQYAARAMDEAAKRFEREKERVGQSANDRAIDPRARESQHEALRRLDVMLAALREEAALGRRSSGGRGGEGGDPERERAKGVSEGDRRAQGGSIADVLQLKLLRALQAEVNQLTDAYQQKHPDTTKLTPDERAELQEIRQQQQDIADLLEALTTAAEKGAEP
jgi:hypothetical protein